MTFVNHFQIEMSEGDSSNGGVIEISTDSLQANIAKNLKSETISRGSIPEVGSTVSESTSGSAVVDGFQHGGGCVASQDSLPSSLDLPRRDSNTDGAAAKEQAMDVDDPNPLTTVHETVSLISGHVKKNFPGVVPSTCLIDPEMVSLSHLH